jgi:translation initiation factor 4G
VVVRYDPNRVVDISASDRVINNAMVILNKLSVETFERLSDQFLNIGMETEEIMSRVVDLIVSKAQMEEHFCFMYADLCKKISDKWVSEDVEEGAAATAAATPAEGAAVTVDLGKIFKTRLLIRCQEEFQQDRDAAIQAVLELSIPEDDKEEKLFVLKKRYTGHMRFVGEIYMKDLLKPKNVYLSIEDLLASRDEEKLSCLCKLLQTVGKKLESYDLRKKKGKFVEYFQKISELSNEKSLSKKVRFGFKDLIEMRANNWVARRVEEKAKKLSEIRGADGAPTQQQQQGGGGPGYGHQGGGRGGNVTPRTQSVTFSHDVRNMPPPGGDGGLPADDWNVVPGKVKKGGAPPGRMTAPGRGYPSKPAPGPSAGPLNSSNKFSALTVGSSSRSGAKSSKGRSQDDDEGVKKEPRVSIPQSSDSQSPFSPNAEGGDDEAMSPTREGSSGAAGEDGELDETMTASVSLSSSFAPLTSLPPPPLRSSPP